MQEIQSQEFKYLKLNAGSIVLYNRRSSLGLKSVIKSKSLDNLKKSYQSKSLTNKSKNKIKKIVWHWSNHIQISQELYKRKKMPKRNYIVMITLTLSSVQKLTDKEVTSKLLHNFLIQLKKKYHKINYLWVAEKQKNGNIHYHIVVDRFVHKDWVQKVWNKIQSNYHYIDDFEKKFHHRNPPSTKITGQKQMHDPAHYITKYINKVDSKQEIECKKWDCSNDLLDYSKIVLRNKDWYRSELFYYFDFFKVKIVQKDFYKVYYLDANFYSHFKFTAIYSDIEHILKRKYELINSDYSKNIVSRYPAVNKLNDCARSLSLF
jgi:hypothetical protein